MTTPQLTAAIKKNPIVVGCVVLSLGLGVALYFRSDAIDDANKQLDDDTTQAQRYALNLTNAVQLKEQLDAVAADGKIIESRLIRATDVGINQQYFYKLESESGVKLLDLRQGTHGTPAAGGKYMPIGFTVSLQGDFAQVITFLRGLEDGTHYCRVVTASCVGGRKGPVTLTLSLELLGRS
jgi:hypothetical protein